jgi:hypothetical protein
MYVLIVVAYYCWWHITAGGYNWTAEVNEIYPANRIVNNAIPTKA